VCNVSLSPGLRLILHMDAEMDLCEFNIISHARTNLPRT